MQTFIVSGRKVIVDECDAHLMSSSKWYTAVINGVAYVRRPELHGNTRKTVMLHRVITGATKGQIVDHINGNGLDNRRANLRLCTIQQNSMNRKLQGGTSRYKGVCWNPKLRSWSSYICANKKRLHIGTFRTEKEAAEAYNAKAISLHGEYARLNPL